MNTSEEEDCDDLPSITVNTSAYNSSTFAMPSAEELAEQRARDLECEHQLEMLRQRARDFGRFELGPSDAGDSEGELALAAAVTTLSVRAERAQAEHAAPAAELWGALAPHLPPHAAALQSSLSASAPRLSAQLSRTVSAVAGALVAPGAWPDDELLCAAALLCVAALARESRCRRSAARALHALLDDHASPDQVGVLVDVLLAALPAARARLLLSDALRSGADAGADLAATALAGATALQLLRAPGARPEALDVAAGAWRACGSAARSVCVQLAGRLLAAAAPGLATPAQRERLLAHLALPPAAASDAHCPERLKTLVGVSKLKLLFSAKNGVSSQARPQPDVSK